MKCTTTKPSVVLLLVVVIVPRLVAASPLGPPTDALDEPTTDAVTLPPVGTTDAVIVPQYIGSCTVDQQLTGTLSKDYNRGIPGWKSLQTDIAKAIDNCGWDPRSPIATKPNLGNTSATILFVNIPTASAAPFLARVAYRAPSLPAPAAGAVRVVLPKAETFYDIRISLKYNPTAPDAPQDTANDIAVTAMTVKPLPSPVLTSLPKVISQIVSPLPKAIPAPLFKGAKPKPYEEPTPQVLKFYEVPLATPWCQLTIKDTGIGNAPGVPPSAPPKLADASTSYSVGPLTHWDFGAGVAGIITTNVNTPVKLDGGKIVLDNSQTQALTFVALNLHPGFDESYLTPSREERMRLLGGVVITPSVGLFAGLGYGIIRGVAAQVGYGVLLTNVLQSGDTLNQAPTRPGHPSRRGAMGVLFAGFEFTLP